MPSILLVDDDPEIRSTFSRALGREGYSVTEAEDGRIALKELQIQAFDLVIVELIMPDVDGIEVTEWIRHNSPSTKIVAMTGGGILSPNDYLKMARYMGASFTLAKPCSRTDFLMVVAAALSQDG